MNRADTTMGGPAREFAQTSWGLVAGLRSPEGPEVRRALESLSQRYWKSVYIFIRAAWKKPNDEAKDLTQAFFLWLVEGNALAGFEPEKGSFRAFVKLLLRNFVRTSEEALRRLKRGGGRTFLTTDTSDVSLVELLPADDGDPEAAFDRAWARQILISAMDETRAALRGGGREMQLRAYEAYELGSGSGTCTYESVAQDLGIKTSAVRNHIFAVRRELKRRILEAISESVANEDQLRKEWSRVLTL